MEGIPMIRENEGRQEVFDPVRRRWVALTPEEGVRQSTIQMLHQRYGYPLELMQVEGSISLNGLTKRCDIVVYGTDGHPMMIVECKKPNVKITQKVCDQACRYNLVLKVPCLVLTNGLNTMAIAIDLGRQTLSLMPDIPRYGC